MHDASLDTGAGRPTIRLARVLDRRPEAVWRALTDRKELETWFPCDIITDEWKVGATLRFVYRQGQWHDLAGTILECDEPRTLEFTWGEETLRFELTEVEGGIRLVFTDQLDAPIAARNAAGWSICLDRLAGVAIEEGLWRRLFDRYVELFGPTLGHQEGPPAHP